MVNETITFHDHITVRAGFLDNKFTHIKCFWQNLKTISVNITVIIIFFVIDETLPNFYALYNCEFKVYIKDKPEYYGLLFRVLADAQDRYASRIIPYFTPTINNLQ